MHSSTILEIYKTSNLYIVFSIWWLSHKSMEYSLPVRQRKNLFRICPGRSQVLQMLVYSLSFPIKDFLGVRLQANPFGVWIQFLGGKIPQVLGVRWCIVSTNTTGVPVLILTKCDKFSRVCAWICCLDLRNAGPNSIDRDLLNHKLSM